MRAKSLIENCAYTLIREGDRRLSWHRQIHGLSRVKLRLHQLFKSDRRIGKYWPLTDAGEWHGVCAGEPTERLCRAGLIRYAQEVGQPFRKTIWRSKEDVFPKEHLLNNVN